MLERALHEYSLTYRGHVCLQHRPPQQQQQHQKHPESTKTTMISRPKAMGTRRLQGALHKWDSVQDEVFEVHP